MKLETQYNIGDAVFRVFRAGEEMRWRVTAGEIIGIRADHLGNGRYIFADFPWDLGEAEVFPTLDEALAHLLRLGIDGGGTE